MNTGRIAISNIAWEAELNDQVVDLMAAFDIHALEIAPAKINPNPLSITAREAADYRGYWEARGIHICAMQALLFGAPYSAIFEGPELQATMLDHLGKVIATAEIVGAKALVFGSPKNRRRHGLSLEQAYDIACVFFRRAGELAQRHGVQLCIEPNPAYYGCDFITTSAEGLALVERVNHPGFGLHLDAAGMTLSREDIPAALTRAAGRIAHFHISEKDLAGIGSGSVDHPAVAAALRTIGYDGWLSIEMRPGEDRLGQIRQAFEIADKYYR